jgi:octaprenyl-diphosphate synthase
VVELVTGAGGIRYAHDKMNEFHKKAKEVLSGFPENEIRKGLEDMVSFVIERKY